MEVKQRDRRRGAQAGSFFLEGFVPSLIGGQAGGAADPLVIVPMDLELEQLVGLRIVLDAFIGQEGDQTFLKGVEAALDLAFGLSVRGDAVGHAQGGESALELGVGVEAVGRRAVAKEGQTVGVEGGRRAVLFEGRTQMMEVAPGGVAGHEGAGEDFTGVIVGGEDQGGIRLGGPPGMGGGVVLPEFTEGGGLPAATGFGAGPLSGHELGEVRADISGHGGAGAVEVEAAGQFVGQQGEVERLAVGQEVGQEIVGRRRPRGVVVAARRLRLEGPVVLQPLMAELVKTGRAQMQSLGGGAGIELAVVEGRQDFLDIERRDAMGELGFFILGPSIIGRSAEGQRARSFSLWPQG